MKPLEVFALDDAMDRVTGSIPYTSLQWNRKYYETGSFVMEVASDVYDKSWAYIYTDDRPETGIIQKVEYSDDQQTIDGVDTIIVSGFFMEALLNRVTFLVEETESQTIKIPKPSIPHQTRSQKPTIYEGTDGKTYYTNKQGETVDTDGNPKPEDTELNEKSYQTNEFGTADDGYQRFNYYQDSDKSKIKSVTWWGAETSHDVEFRDDRGNVFYRNESGSLCQAYAVAESSGGTYWRQLENWERGPKEYVKKIKGPWQLTEIDEVTKEADNVQTCLRWARRMLGNGITVDEPDFAGVKKVLNPSLKQLGDLMYEELRTVEASFRVLYSFSMNQITLSVWRGLDRTQAQTDNPFCTFSDTWGTMYGYSASWDESNYKNKCYVLYDYDIPTAWTSSGAPALQEVKGWNDNGTLYSTIGWKVPYKTKRGYEVVRLEDGKPDMETRLDKRSEKPDGDDKWSRELYSASEYSSAPSLPAGLRQQYEAYEASIRSDGEKLLANDYNVITNVETGTLVTDGYLSEFDLGDKIDLLVEKIGVVLETRIQGVSEVHEAGRSDIKIEIGEKLMTDIKKAVMV